MNQQLKVLISNKAKKSVNESATLISVKAKKFIYLAIYLLWTFTVNPEKLKIWSGLDAPKI